MPAQPLTSTTQVFLDIHDITNNLVIMKNGTTSIILTVDAMNFGLLAEEEQDGIIYAYAGLLNSLNYPIQIVIRSQTKDVTQYLTLLKDQEEKTSSEKIRERIRTYREFVSNLIHERNVLDKKFYVVIPATGMELGVVSAQSFLPGAKPVDISTIERTVIIEKARSILEPKRDHLIAQFARIGLYARELETQEIIQLFYLSYNPEAAEGQEITDSFSYTTPLVKASMQTSVDEMLTQAASPTPVTAPTPDQAPLTPPANQPPSTPPNESQAPPTQVPTSPSEPQTPAVQNPPQLSVPVEQPSQATQPVSTTSTPQTNSILPESEVGSPQQQIPSGEFTIPPLNTRPVTPSPLPSISSSPQHLVSSIPSHQPPQPTPTPATPNSPTTTQPQQVTSPSSTLPQQSPAPNPLPPVAEIT